MFTYGAYFILKYNIKKNKIEIMTEGEDRDIHLIGQFPNGNFAYISYIHRSLYTNNSFCYFDIIAKKSYFIKSFDEYNDINWNKIILLNDGIGFVDELFDKKAVFYITEKGKIKEYKLDYLVSLKTFHFLVILFV